MLILFTSQSRACTCSQGLALPRAGHSVEIALAGSRRQSSTLAAAPVLFTHAVVIVAKQSGFIVVLVPLSISFSTPKVVPPAASIVSFCADEAIPFSRMCCCIYDAMCCRLQSKQLVDHTEKLVQAAWSRQAEMRLLCLMHQGRGDWEAVQVCDVFCSVLAVSIHRLPLSSLLLLLALAGL